MAVPLANTTLNTSRSGYTPSSGTSAPVPYTQGIPAHTGSVHADAYLVPPAGVLEANYESTVDVGTDIRTGDGLFILLPDGVTHWPGSGTMEYYSVTYIKEATPGPLQHRIVYVKRSVYGGPAQS